MSSLISRRSVVKGAVGLALSGAAAPSLGADWRPSDTIKVIAPAAPGGITDTMSRLLAKQLQDVWGKPAIVENRAGGGSTIGAIETLRQKADGLTLFIGNPGANAVAYTIFKRLAYTPNDFIPVSNMIRLPNIIAARPTLPINTLGELISFIKQNPGKLSYGTSGVGQSPHLSAVLFLQLIRGAMTHVPFRGASLALSAAMGEHIDILVDNLYPALPQAREGKLKALAVTTGQRVTQAPDIPSVSEGSPELKSYDLSTWIGVFVKSGTSDEAVTAISSEVEKMLARDTVRATLADIGAIIDYRAPREFLTFVQSETQKYAEIIKKEGLELADN